MSEVTFQDIVENYPVFTTMYQYSLSSWQSSVLSLLVISCIWGISKLLYNLYSHPLAKFPGPLLARSTLLWRMTHSMRGQLHLAIQKEHHNHGPILRISPNELSFASVSSLKTIYGHQSAGQPPVLKTEHYDMLGAGFGAPSMGSERDPEKHNGMKKTLAPALSSKAVMDQESVVSELVDKFVLRLAEFGAEAEVNITHWYDYLTLDILGALAFSRSFGCLDNGNSSAWPTQMVEYMFFATLFDNLRRLPLIGSLMNVFFQSSIPKQNEHSRRSREKVAERLADRPSRSDFFTKFVEQYDAGSVSQEQLAAHAATLVVGGSETTSTFLGATTFHLFKNPEAFQRLKDEIRSTFDNYHDITATAAQSLPYLQAVIAEGLRIYPPLSLGFPRASPGMFVDELWIPKGTEIFTSYWTVTHSAQNFSDPYKFIPERWLDPKSTDVKEASQPFSLGRRACSGRAFAYMQMSLTIAKMFWKYDLELVNTDLDWNRSSKIYLLWVRPDLIVRFIPCVEA